MRRINLDIVLGVLIGIAASLLFASPWDWRNECVNWRACAEYRDFIVSILALVGAVGAVIAVMRQINHAQEMEDERRRRQAYAARKMLPHALSSLSQYAASCLNALRQNDDGAALDISAMRLAPISNLDIEPIKQLLEFGEPDIQDRLSELLLRLQIQQSQLAPDDRDPQEWAFSILADALEIHARANSLYDYAIVGTVPPSLNFEDIRNSAGLFNWTEDEINSLRRSTGTHWT